MKAISLSCKIHIVEYTFSQDRINDARDGNELHFIGRLKKGSARLVSDDITLDISEGDVFFIPKKLKYVSYWSVSDSAVIFDSFGFSEFPCAAGKGFCLQKLSADKRAVSLIDAISDEGKEHQNSLRISGLFLSLLSELLPHMTGAEKEDKQSILAARAVNIMREDTSLDIPSVSAACSVSQSGLYAAFRKSGYKTPNEERQKILVEKAVNLLISTDEPIENISSSLGFSSSSYFRKIFGKIMGKSPRQVRRESFI